MLSTPAGQRSSVDDAVANQRSLAAQVLSAQAQLRQAQINLDYTEIQRPCGRQDQPDQHHRRQCGFTELRTAGVDRQPGPDVCAVSRRIARADRVAEALCRQGRHECGGGQAAAAGRNDVRPGRQDRLCRADGLRDHRHDPAARAHPQSAAQSGPRRGQPVERPLVDGAFVTVLVEGIQPVMALGIPRKAVLSDQQGDYVYVVGADNKVEQRRIQLGQSTPTTAVVAGGLKEGEMVVTDGIQRVRPGIEVNPGPASPPPRRRHLPHPPARVKS